MYVIDDDLDEVNWLLRELKSLGRRGSIPCSVRTHYARNSDELWRGLVDESIPTPDLIITDHNMERQGCHGDTLCKRIRALAPYHPGLNMPLWIISGRKQFHDQEQAHLRETYGVEFYEKTDLKFGNQLVPRLRAALAKPDVAVIGSDGSVAQAILHRLAHASLYRRIYACGKLDKAIPDNKREASLRKMRKLTKRIGDEFRSSQDCRPLFVVPEEFRDIRDADYAVICAQSQYNIVELIQEHGLRVREKCYELDSPLIQSIGQSLLDAGFQGNVIVLTNPVEYMVSLLAAQGFEDESLLGVCADRSRFGAILLRQAAKYRRLHPYVIPLSSVVGAHQGGLMLPHLDRCGFLTVNDTYLPFTKAKFTEEDLSALFTQLQRYAFDIVTEDGVTTPNEMAGIVDKLFSMMVLGEDYRSHTVFMGHDESTVPNPCCIVRSGWDVEGREEFASTLVPVRFTNIGHEIDYNAISPSLRTERPRYTTSTFFDQGVSFQDVVLLYADIDKRIRKEAGL